MPASYCRPIVVASDETQGTASTHRTSGPRRPASRTPRSPACSYAYFPCRQSNRPPRRVLGSLACTSPKCIPHGRGWAQNRSRAQPRTKTASDPILPLTAAVSRYLSLCALLAIWPLPSVRLSTNSVNDSIPAPADYSVSVVRQRGRYFAFRLSICPHTDDSLFFLLRVFDFPIDIGAVFGLA